MRTCVQCHVHQLAFTKLLQTSCCSRHALAQGSRPCHALAQEHRARLSQEEIQARIAASQARKAQSLAAQICCPSCNQPQVTVDRLLVHAERCCPDLLGDRHKWQQAADTSKLLQEAQQQEEKMRSQALQITFRSGETDGQGNLVRHTAEEVARRMGIPVTRADNLVKRALRAVPLVADDIPVEVLYEDDWLIAVNKPPGVQTAPVHRYRGGSMVNRLLSYLGRPPHVVHRLDMDTSGVLVMAKDGHTAALCHQQFRNQAVSKLYLALGAGDVAHLQRPLQIDAPIGSHPAEGVARMVRPDGGQEARTTALAVSWNSQVDLAALGGAAAPLLDPSRSNGQMFKGAALVAAAPQHGRTHQIRVHLAHVGNPLIGDTLYGINGPWLARHALHAARIQLLHPVLQTPVSIQAQLPDDMLQAASALGVDTSTLTMQPGSQDNAVEQLWSLITSAEHQSKAKAVNKSMNKA